MPELRFSAQTIIYYSEAHLVPKEYASQVEEKERLSILSISEIANMLRSSEAKVEIRSMGVYGEGVFATRTIKAGEYFVYSGTYTTEMDHGIYALRLNANNFKDMMVNAEESCVSRIFQHLPAQCEDTICATANLTAVAHYIEVDDALLPITILRAKRNIEPDEIVGYDYGTIYWKDNCPALFKRNGDLHQQRFSIKFLGELSFIIPFYEPSMLKALLPSPESNNGLLFILHEGENQLFYFSPEFQADFEIWHTEFLRDFQKTGTLFSSDKQHSVPSMSVPNTYVHIAQTPSGEDCYMFLPTGAELEKFQRLTGGFVTTKTTRGEAVLILEHATLKRPSIELIESGIIRINKTGSVKSAISEPAPAVASSAALLPPATAIDAKLMASARLQLQQVGRAYGVRALLAGYNEKNRQQKTLIAQGQAAFASKDPPLIRKLTSALEETELGLQRIAAKLTA